jgi:hypothetical protein
MMLAKKFYNLGYTVGTSVFSVYNWVFNILAFPFICVWALYKVIIEPFILGLDEALGITKIDDSVAACILAFVIPIVISLMCVYLK